MKLLILLKVVFWIAMGILLVLLAFADDGGNALHITVSWIAKNTYTPKIIVALLCIVLWIFAKILCLVFGGTCFCKAFKPNVGFLTILFKVRDCDSGC